MDRQRRKNNRPDGVPDLDFAPAPKTPRPDHPRPDNSRRDTPRPPRRETPPPPDLAIGSVHQGVVRTIKPYGMFVEVIEAGKTPWTGMVHISEVSRDYVENIHDVFQEGQLLRVKVISITDGRVSLSIKQLEPPSDKPRRPRENFRDSRDSRDGRDTREGRDFRDGRGERDGRDSRDSRPASHDAPHSSRPAPTPAPPPSYPPRPVYEKKDSGDASFEDMLSRFKQRSEERIGDINRNTERKNRSRRK